MPPAMEQNPIAPIYQALIDHCQRAELPAPWQELEVDADCYQCPEGDGALVPHLIETFSQRDLVRSRVLVRQHGSERLRLRRELRDPSGYLVALRQEAGAPPYDVIAEEGCLSATQWPVSAVLQDACTLRWMAEMDELMIVFSIDQLVLLRSLGIPTTLDVGLEAGDVRLWDELAAYFEWERTERQEYCEPTDAAASETVPGAGDTAQEDDAEGDALAEAGPGQVLPATPPSLGVIAFDLLRLTCEAPPELSSLVDFTSQVHDLGIECGLRFWTPTAETLRVSSVRLQLGEVAGVRHALQASLEDDSALVADGLASAANLSEARAEVLQYAEHPANEAALTAALQQLELCLDAEIASPIVAQARSSGDARRRAAIENLAELSKQAFRLALATDAQLRKVLPSILSPGSQPKLPVMAQYLSVLDRLTALIKAVAQ